MFEKDPKNGGRIALSFKNILILFTLFFVMGGAIHLVAPEAEHEAGAVSTGEVQSKKPA
jgi:hypothetical protein